MNIQGWEFDPALLPHWDNHTAFPHCEDHLFASPNGDAAALIYSVLEVGMLNYRGFCAIYHRKTEPILRLAIRYVNFWPFAHFSKDGNYVFLKAFYRGGVRFLLVLDIKREAYAVVPFSPPNISYTVTEEENGVFTLAFPEEQLRGNPALAEFNATRVDINGLKWRSWSALAEGGDLNLQERGWKFFFTSKEKIWRESLKQLELGALSSQQFVDLNRCKALYWIYPLRVDKYGHTQVMALANTDFDGQYIPVFSSYEAYVDYLACRGEAHLAVQIRRIRLKDLFAFLDSGYPQRDYGLVIDPHGEFIAIPPGMRITPKSLRY